MLHISLFAKKVVKGIKALFFLTCWLEQRERDRKLLIPNWEPLANNRSSLRIPICHFVHLEQPSLVTMGIVQTGHLASCGHLYYFDFRCHFHVHAIPLFEQQCLVSAGSSPIHSGINVNISESCGYRKGPVLDPGASQNLNFKELLEATFLSRMESLWHSLHSLLCILFIDWPNDVSSLFFSVVELLVAILMLWHVSLTVLYDSRQSSTQCKLWKTNWKKH